MLQIVEEMDSNLSSSLLKVDQEMVGTKFLNEAIYLCALKF